MKKRLISVILVILIAATAFGCAPRPSDYSGIDFAVPELANVEETLIGDLKEFVYGDRAIEIKSGMTADESILNRTAFTRDADGLDGAGEKAAAKRLRSMLSHFGYADRDEEGFDRNAQYFYVQPFSVTYRENVGLMPSTKDIYSQNVAAVVPAKGERLGKVIMTAHYDNAYGSELLQGEKSHGVYAGGLGVAAVLRAADILKDAALNFDLEFIFFGASLAGNLGADYFVSKMSASAINETLLVYNLDFIGGGDYDYLYCDDVATEHEEYLRAAAGKTGTQYLRAPKDKQAYLTTDNAQSYMHAGLNSDHYPFYKKGLNTATVLSMNWSASDTYGIYESSKNESVMQTDRDTLDRIAELYPDYAERTANALRVFCTAISEENFVETMQTSSRERMSTQWLQGKSIAAYTLGGVIILCMIALALTAGALRKKHPIPPPEPIEKVQEDAFGDYADDAEKKTDGGNSNDPFKGY